MTPLHVVQCGAGPELVMLHGWGFHSGVWAPLVERLSACFRLTLVDLPGHGHSPPLPHGRRLAAVAEAVIQAAPSQASWLGWSLGGLVALQAAINFPRGVNKLVLVASTPCFVAAADWPYGVTSKVFMDFSASLQHDPAETLKRFVWLQTRGAERAKGVAQVRLAHFNASYRPCTQGLEDGLALLQESDLRVELETIACPTLAIMGQRDPLVPPNVGAWLSAHLPQGQVCMIPGAGHAPFLSHGQVFQDTVSHFLQA
ncbi:pimeloyl-ACP methyl ester esterase BioH [Nitrosococcus watsonii]|uniref:Pimeloyl-[acyl-carrier protein] methyl ester esterase n=1 Tax=Nitrosococcus watsoni (strain C-113) TaxID=105559 RepID=D8K4V4_NITWC|nr:pimeloyl-ACP methyl ester esterase BioH [Nitrosococcus watsonii]ADJ27931.1 bioH protein [Nitrosococcus watsonii C-113]